jgi:glycine hydroxymethyltransferase
LSCLMHTDPEVFDILKCEERRQMEGIELIPSENYASCAVMEALGSVFVNKYSEGYPGRRYYGGNVYVDMVEELAMERARKLFKTDYHVNVQPYSGSPANMAIYLALLDFGDKVMGMELSHGGHLTHGHPVNFSGMAYKFIRYGVDPETEMLDYDRIEEMAISERPKLIVSGTTCYPRTIDFERFADIARKAGAYLLADISHIAGLIAAGVHPSPFGHADVVMTTTHKTLRGPRGAIIFCREEMAQRIDRAVFPGIQGGPHDNVTAAIAVALGEAMRPEFKEYGIQVKRNAEVLAEELKRLGARIVSGGTDNHIVLVDIRSFGIGGKEAEDLLDKVGIAVNKNMIPFDPSTPMNPSGIRLGTPAVTTRGMKEGEMRLIASWIVEVLSSKGKDEEVMRRVRKEVRELAMSFPIPGIRSG